jgi:malate:Na+ symporter
LLGSLSVAGFLASRWIGLHPVDGAIVNLTRAALGGTGDVAILNAGRRVELMSFAQISTRIGGAATVAIALLAMGFVGR